MYTINTRHPENLCKGIISLVLYSGVPGCQIWWFCSWSGTYPGIPRVVFGYIVWSTRVPNGNTSSPARTHCKHMNISPMIGHVSGCSQSICWAYTLGCPGVKSGCLATLGYVPGFSPHVTTGVYSTFGIEKVLTGGGSQLREYSIIAFIIVSYYSIIVVEDYTVVLKSLYHRSTIVLLTIRIRHNSTQPLYHCNTIIVLY